MLIETNALPLHQTANLHVYTVTSSSTRNGAAQVFIFKQFSLPAYAHCAHSDVNKHTCGLLSTFALSSHQRVPVIGFDRLAIIASIEAAYCRCRPRTDHRIGLEHLSACSRLYFFVMRRHNNICTSDRKSAASVVLSDSYLL